MKPLVSVVIPATRADDWLREAVASVLADGYEPLEVIVVWDGPADAAPAEIPGARVVVTGGRGTPAANNRGLAEARGEFIARLDSDDRSLPGRFAAQVRALEAAPDAALAVTNAYVIDADGRRTGDYPAVRQADLPAALLPSNPLVHSTFMFRRSAVRYDERCVRMQDYELALRTASESSIAVVEEPLVEYRVHPSQSGRKTQAFWQYVPVVLRSRRRLARRLGAGQRARQWARDGAWFAAQYASHRGLRDRYAGLNGGRTEPDHPTEPAQPAVPAERRLRVLQSVSEAYSTDNPYIAQLVDSARTQVDVDYLTPRRLLLGRYDVLHVQWPDLLLRSRGRAATTLKRLLVALGLLRLRLTGTRVVQTLHNVTPHEPGDLVEGLMIRAINAMTDSWILLTDDPKAAVGGRRVVVPHGHYRDWFEGLALPGHVKPADLLFFGQVRPYKGVPALLEAFAATDDPGMSLAIAGAASDPALAAAVAGRAESDPRVSALLRRIPDDELAALVRASTLVVLPYDEFYNSGAALLALSLDTPILVPSNAVTERLAAEVGTSWVLTYDGPLTAQTLVSALQQARTLPDEARPDLDARDWNVLTTPLVEAYR